MILNRRSITKLVWGMCLIPTLSKFVVEAAPTVPPSSPTPPPAAATSPPPATGSPATKPTAAKTEPKAHQTSPVEPILLRMRASAAQLRAGKASSETVQLQKQVVQDLDALIKASQQQRQSPPPSSRPDGASQPQPKSSEASKQQQQSQPQNSQQQAPQKARSNPQGTSDDHPKSARESNPNRRPTSSDPKPNSANNALQEKEVWGHLPPALRRELLNIYQEKFIPKYDELVRKYYEALSGGASEADDISGQGSE